MAYTMERSSTEHTHEPEPIAADELTPELQTLMAEIGDPPDPGMTRLEWAKELIEIKRLMDEEEAWVYDHMS